MGDAARRQVRVDIDENDVRRFRRMQQRSLIYGTTQNIRSPHVERTDGILRPKSTLTGASAERIDTRVLQVITVSRQRNNATVYWSSAGCLY
jgi:hypothetical protein